MSNLYVDWDMKKNGLISHKTWVIFINHYC